MALSEDKTELRRLVGRTITGFATSAVDGRLTSVMLTLDDKSAVEVAVPHEGAWEGAHFTARRVA